MKWQNIDLVNMSWLIPDTKNGTQQTILLTDTEYEILQKRFDRRQSFEWVFPSKSVSGHLVDPKKGWAGILKRAQIEDLHMRKLLGTRSLLL
jgi:hypothetical protein